MMKITAVETVRLGAHANILFVRLHTDAAQESSPRR